MPISNMVYMICTDISIEEDKIEENMAEEA